MKKIMCFLAALFLLVTLAQPFKADTYPEKVTDSLAEDAGNFTPYGGTWEYTEDGYTQTDPMISGSSYNYGSYFKYAYEDFAVSFRMKIHKVGDSEGYAGILFRKAKPNDTAEMSGYLLSLKGYGTLYLQDWTQTQTLFGIPIDNPYDWHTYKFEVEGNKIRCYVDDELRHSITNGAFASGFFSFTTGTASASFADFEIVGVPTGSADTIGTISDGNMDKEASDVIFEERAAIDEAETKEEPSWFTTMISKLNGYEAGSEIIVSDGGAANGDNITRIIAYVICGIAIVLVIVVVIMFIARKGNKKAPVAMLLILSCLLMGATLSTGSLEANADDTETLDTAEYYKVFYVSPTGDDSNAGTEEAPFKTLRKAQEAVRSVTAEQTGDIAIVVREGRYTLGSKLSFEEADSGCNGYNVVWMSYPGEVVKISGGREISGWTEGENNVWIAQTDLNDIDSLYINDVRADVASSGVEPLDLIYIDTEQRSVVVNVKDVEGITGGSIMMYQDWETPILPIKSIDVLEDNPTAAAITFEKEISDLYFKVTPSMLFTGCTKYVLQNDKALLDEPGEYYYDKESKTLHYIPREGEDMTSASVYAPALNGLIEIQGNSISSHVHNLVFRGLVFEYSGFISKYAHEAFMEYQSNHYFVKDNGTNYPYIDVPTATIHIQNADNISIERCVIRHSGGNGVNFYHSVWESRLDGCLVTDISGTGVMTGVYAYGLVPGNLYTPTDPEKMGVHNVDITNNTITWIGREFKCGCGIANMLGYEILIRNNEVAYGTSIGIANGWGWSTRDYIVKENTIAYNDVHHIAMSTVDVAGIYTLNAQKGTQIRANYVHDNQRSGTGHAGAPCYGLYLDEGSNWLVVTDNVTLNNYSDGIIFHNTGGSIYSLGNDTLNETTIKNAGVGKAYASISLRKSSDVGESLVENVSLGQPENSMNGEVGMTITVNEDVTVKALGRFYYLGNSDVHKLTIYDAADGSVVATTSVDMSEGTTDENGFKYALLDKEVKLETGKTYYVVSSETEGRDVWMNRMCQVKCDSRFTVDGGITYENGNWKSLAKPGPGYMYGPVNLLFRAE